MNIKNMKRMYTLSVVLLPFFSLYRGIGYSIDLGTLFVVVCFSLNLIVSRERIKIPRTKEWYFYIAYILIGMVCLFLVGNPIQEKTEILQRVMKNILYILIFLFSYQNKYFEIKVGKKIYSIMVIISTMYLYMQAFCARILNVILWAYIPNLVKKYSYVQDIQITDPAAFRPSALFYEPSHYFIFVYVALIFYMFQEQKCRAKNILCAMFVSGGVVLSTTSMGILFVGIIWGIWCVWQIYRAYMNKRVDGLFIVTGMSGIVAICIALNSSRIMNALIRVFDTEYEGGNAIEGRGMGYYEILQMPLKNFVFGYGYGNVENNYYPSVAFNFLCLGLVGSILILCIYFKIYSMLSLREEKIAFIAYVVLCFYGEIFMSFYLLFFMSIFANGGRRENGEKT